MTPARLAEIKDRCGDEEGATAADGRALLAEVERLRAWLARIAAGHGWPTPVPGTQGIMAQAALDGEPAP